MVRALYTAASGMMVESHRMDAMTSNLYYAQVPGFKAAGVVRASRSPTTSVPPTDVQTAMVGEYFDPSPGPLRPTNRSLDFALEGEGFFTIQTKSGVGYTRDGRFRKAADGVIKDGNGHALLGQKGPIRIPADAAFDAPIVVETDGTVLVEGRAVDRLRLEDFPGFRGLEAAGGSLFFPDGSASPQENPQLRVVQGSVEDANTSTVLEMTRTIESMRAFESYQKVMQAVDEATGQAVQRIGRLA